MLPLQGTGKATFITKLAGRLKLDGGGVVRILNVTYKPQKIRPKCPSSRCTSAVVVPCGVYPPPQFITDVMALSSRICFCSIISCSDAAGWDEHVLGAARDHIQKRPA
ncbi:ATP-binding cassette sub-family E member 1 [Arapaima gigas]